MPRTSSLAAFAGLLASTLLVTLAAAGTLTFDAPKDWTSTPPSSTMRVAEFTLAKAAGDPEDATVTIFFFGGTGGSVQANIDRWIGQIAQPDGKPSKDAAKTSTMEAHGLKVTLVDVSGTFVAEVTPGSAEHFNKPNFRQIAGYIETPGGPYFIKLVGPAPTVAKWHASFDAFLKTLRYE